MRQLALIAAAGTAVGFLTGLFGVGGGFVIVPALTLVLGLTMPQAVGTSLLVIAINAAMALAAGEVGRAQWSGASCCRSPSPRSRRRGRRDVPVDRLPARTLLRGFAWLLVAVATYTGTQAVIGLAS